MDTFWLAIRRSALWGVAGAWLLGTTPARAQEAICGSDYWQQYRQADQPAKARMDAIERHIQAYQQSGRVARAAGQIVVIPVVVHVVWNTQAQNISDAQIQSQIEVLNEDYRLANADQSKIPARFRTKAADFQLHFVLASQTPNGVPTGGILRRQTSAKSFDFDFNNHPVMSSERGGDDPWPSDRYLNIWVCNLLDKRGFGYATLLAETLDGVVVDFTAFGRGHAARAPFNLGRVATHEVGHWLNLLHVWGDERPSQNPCSLDDGVPDTPRQAGPRTKCPDPNKPLVSCGNAAEGGDMFMNFMDYTNDACKFFFTQGQKERAEALFAPGGPRASFVCQPQLVLNQAISGNGTFQATDALTASGSVSIFSRVSYQAGERIILRPGFRARPRRIPFSDSSDPGRFSARIGACTNPAPLAQAARRAAAESREPALVLKPNPASTTLSVEYPFQAQAPYTLKVYDLGGRLVLTRDFVATGAAVELNLRNLPSGLYVLQCIQPAGGRSTSRFVVAR